MKKYLFTNRMVYMGGGIEGQEAPDTQDKKPDEGTPSEPPNVDDFKKGAGELAKNAVPEHPDQGMHDKIRDINAAVNHPRMEPKQEDMQAVAQFVAAKGGSYKVPGDTNTYTDENGVKRTESRPALLVTYQGGELNIGVAPGSTEKVVRKAE